ncbi:PAS sensor protein [Natrinema pellirubrum DSM 15624]|uniref:histidine kinase n=1 Tax=Natrinema pellirubrum (strain DSM 15624 / CIP 106293 / JCM 10476 / NCIMB 786 / 157) TaxID=797303 RepID=L0JJL2_NATP1|nr:PAS domain S-box protein [Natrinema pellirubrum]AGB30536.1 PAS domain S-box [Natrinema pellirubrum DSM 15624]ELY77306.1 PAS sensor protein [Natrinema pellirubrum DSM 15624]
MVRPGSDQFSRPTTVIYADPSPGRRRRTVDALESAANTLTVVPVATPTALRDALAGASERTCVVTERDLGETSAMTLYDQVAAGEEPPVPFVLYTGDGDELLASDAIGAGLAGYVPRGHEDSLERLLAQIRRAVEEAERDETPTDPRSDGAVETERDRFRSLFENIPDPVVLTVRDDGNRILDVNPAFEEMFGYDRETLVGTSVEDRLVPDGSESVDAYGESGPGGSVTTIDERVTAEGPREFLLRVFAVDLGDEIHEYAIYTDIAAQKRRERDLERYRTLVDTVGDPMFVLDADGRIEMVNEAMAAVLGTTRSDLVGDHPSDYMTDEDVERATATLREILADEDRTWETYEMQFEPVDGDPLLVENNVAPLVDEGGTFTGSVGVIRDISDRKERERRIQRLHEGTRRLMAAERTDEVARVATEIARDALSLELNSVYLYEEEPVVRSAPACDATAGTDSTTESRDEHGVLVPAAATDETEALLGTVPALGPDSIAWDAFTAGETLVHGDVRRADNVRNPETSMRSEIHIPLGDAGIFIAGSTTPNDFDAETVTLARILAANVEAALERARREAELAARTAELERQNDRLDAFASTVSHDLRNPLTLAAGHLENLEAHVDSEGERYREEIDWALERMNTLIENVLTLARSGQRLTKTDAVDLDEIVERAHRTVDPDLDLVHEDSLPTVEADPERLLVCFENAFRNAREHVGEDVTVTVERTADGFAIADDGPGVPPAERTDILESGYSTDPDGTGFGLAIVSEAIEAHGWSITVEESAAGGLRLAVSFEDGDMADL